MVIYRMYNLFYRYLKVQYRIISLNYYCYFALLAIKLRNHGGTTLSRMVYENAACVLYCIKDMVFTGKSEFLCSETSNLLLGVELNMLLKYLTPTSCGRLCATKWHWIFCGILSFSCVIYSLSLCIPACELSKWGARIQPIQETGSSLIYKSFIHRHN